MQQRLELDSVPKGKRVAVRSDLPAGFRVMQGFYRAGETVLKAGTERDLDTYARKVIGEAIRYNPPFLEHIGEALHPTHVLLLHHGASSQRATTGLIDEQVDKIVSPTASTSSPQMSDSLAALMGSIRDVQRTVARSMHPDTATSTGVAIAAEDSQRALAQVSRAKEIKDLGRAQDAYLQAMPQLLVTRVEDLLGQGRTFDDIAREDPQLINQLELTHYLDWKRLPQRGFLGSYVPKVPKKIRTKVDADNEAKRIRREQDDFERAMGFGMVMQLVGGLYEGDTVALTDPQRQALQALSKQMEGVGGWIGGCEDFIRRNGAWVGYGTAKLVGDQMADAILGLPQTVHQVVETLVTPDDVELSFDEAMDSMRSSVQEVNRRARQYADRLQEATRPKIAATTARYNEPTTIIDFGSDKKNNKNEYIIKKDKFNKENW